MNYPEEYGSVEYGGMDHGLRYVEDGGGHDLRYDDDMEGGGGGGGDGGGGGGDFGSGCLGFILLISIGIMLPDRILHWMLGWGFLPQPEGGDAGSIAGLLASVERGAFIWVIGLYVLDLMIYGKGKMSYDSFAVLLYPFFFSGTARLFYFITGMSTFTRPWGDSFMRGFNNPFAAVFIAPFVPIFWFAIDILVGALIWLIPLVIIANAREQK